MYFEMGFFPEFGEKSCEDFPTVRYLASALISVWPGDPFLPDGPAQSSPRLRLLVSLI